MTDAPPQQNNNNAMMKIVRQVYCNQGQREFMELIQDTNEIMSCENQTLLQLSSILRRLLQKNPDQNWILEIEVLVNMFEIKKLKLDTNIRTMNEFDGYWKCKIGLYHTILKVIPVKR